MAKAKLSGLLAILLLTANAIPAHAENDAGLKADEIKNIRFISRAILKSRLNEKKRIEQELTGQRKDLAQMRQMVESLEQDMRKALLAPPQLISPLVTQAATGKAAAKTIQANPQAVDLSTRKQQRSARFRDTASRLAGKRQALEKAQPTWWQFWETKTRKQRRDDKLIAVSRKVEARLNDLAKADKVDLKEITKLKEMLTLKRPKVDLKDMAPTIQSRTK